MNENHALPRSPELMSAGDTALLVVDVQERLDRRHRRPPPSGLQRAAADRRGQDPRPAGHGHRAVSARASAPRWPSWRSGWTRSARSSPSVAAVARRFSTSWEASGIHKLLVCGIEAHVCVQQTVLDLLADGWRVYVAVDAVGSRFDIDYRTALGRMDSSGATLTTTEAALFEWCRVAGTPEFKQISRLVREEAPE